ncbi:MAG: FliA/WhiG family RNA polymerase sigma factor [Deltaproteobacteria bacterium]|nr:MAG: FliA/WhiG family RNA polymerase sigma factor [Deltaproteobacteria bacterium]RLC23302.1 MAG: FliA/WhiG family RNA polymerase sigma factor [Deltaproteobacteria bacterium]HGY12168.1 FliA/WhiG family RNA polymerase sigma factor [Desulfobacterales bacterium]
MTHQHPENKTDEDSWESWREKSIIEYSYLVKHIAARFAMRLPSSVFFGELVSAGSLGLIDAVDKFDTSKHVSLKTYAQYRIKGAILDELRSMDPYSRSMRKKIQDIAKAAKTIEDLKGSPASDEEICEELGVSLDAYYDMLTNIHGASVLSLDEFIKTKKNDTYSRTSFQSGIKGDDNPADCFDREELKFVLAQTIKMLTPKEQMVVSLYYYDELTLKEIGEVLNLTESRICQIHTAILVKLKVRLQDYFN